MRLTERVKNILFHPSQEWAVIEQESTSVSELYRSYVVPLAAIGPVASIIGLSIIGINVPFVGSYRIPLMSAIGQAVVNYVLALAGVYVLALIIDALAATFQGTKSNIQALKVAAYSSTPAWLAGVFILISALGFLQILGLYSLCLLYLGLPMLMKTPQDKALVYTIVVVVAALVIFAVIGAVGSLFITYPTPGIPPRIPAVP
jgi:hypothetical protein